ncbi:MAG: NADH/ubiquinone/plastoquinone (complex I) [Betaproteobacteria bacterium]|nr:NADH/ubiquinone/plastoquinone (complex I) [Betaproteobacteria bacterium]
MTPQSLLLVATLALPLAMLAACVVRTLRRHMPGWLAMAPVPGIAAALFSVDAPPFAFGGGSVRLALALDLPGALLLGVAALLWSAAGAYAASYFGDSPKAERFAVCWLMALAGCLGVFVAADMVSLYALLGLLTLGATGLVLHDDTPRARRAAAVYVGLALTGESLALVGFILLAAAMPGDSLLVRDAAAALSASPQRDLTLALLVGGFGIKAGLVPLHVWMPLAHSAAPVPASSVLSGAVVKVGIIGLIRFLPFDAPLAAWGEPLTALGMFTALYAVAMGVTQKHPKAVLAYSSVSQMGVVVAVLGMGMAAADETVPVLAAFYAAHHVLVKGALFLAFGVVAATGSARVTPTLALATVLAAGLGGLPFTGGALAKFAVKAPLGDGLMGMLGVVSAIGTTLLMLHFVVRLRAHTATEPEATAGAGLTLPWLAMALASIAVPWALYCAAPPGALPDPLAPKYLWEALWPVALGAVLAVVLTRAGDRLPRIPEGDIAVAIDVAAHTAITASRRFEHVDGWLRRWPTAGVALLGLAIALGAALLR